MLNKNEVCPQPARKFREAEGTRFLIDPQCPFSQFYINYILIVIKDTQVMAAGYLPQTICQFPGLNHSVFSEQAMIL
jgi:hypothetical protein